MLLRLVLGRPFRLCPCILWMCLSAVSPMSAARLRPLFLRIGANLPHPVQAPHDGVFPVAFALHCENPLPRFAVFHLEDSVSCFLENNRAVPCRRNEQTPSRKHRHGVNSVRDTSGRSRAGFFKLFSGFFELEEDKVRAQLTRWCGTLGRGHGRC